MIRTQRASRTSLWLLPLCCLLAGVLLSILMITIDRRYHGRDRAAARLPDQQGIGSGPDVLPP
jgi:hypothetical protein